MNKKYMQALEEIIDKFAEQMIRANKEELTAINKTNAIEYLYRTPQVRLLQQALQRLESIDNANPSEALQGVDILYANAVDLTTENTKYLPEYLKPIRDKIKQSLLKAQEQEKENTRAFDKDIIIDLDKTLKQTIDKPILYVNSYGNKYIVSQKLFDEQCNVLALIKEYQVDLWLLKQCDYENYIRIRKKSMVSVGQIVNEDGVILEDEITEEYFDLVKRYFDGKNNYR